MTSLLEAWRAIDPAARLVSGSPQRLVQQVRGLARTRAAAPRLPPPSPGQLLVVDGDAMLDAGLDGLLASVRDAELDPVGLWIVAPVAPVLEAGGEPVPVLAGAGSPASLASRIEAYLDDPAAHQASLAAALRLAAAEAALADPTPAAPAGVVAARLRRGVAVSIAGALVALVPRPAGRAIATRFAAVHGRLLGHAGASPGVERRTRDGLWILDRLIAEGSVAWLFDDLPLSRIDALGLESLSVTLRALVRRRPAGGPLARHRRPLPPSSGDPLRDTLIAVARANGRVAPAARVLGVHRNTVLYRLRRASAQLGIDPRRPEDAIRLLRQLDSRD